MHGRCFFACDARLSTTPADRCTSNPSLQAVRSAGTECGACAAVGSLKSHVPLIHPPPAQADMHSRPTRAARTPAAGLRRPTARLRPPRQAAARRSGSAPPPRLLLRPAPRTRWQSPARAGERVRRARTHLRAQPRACGGCSRHRSVRRKVSFASDKQRAARTSSPLRASASHRRGARRRQQPCERTPAALPRAFQQRLQVLVRVLHHQPEVKRLHQQQLALAQHGLVQAVRAVPCVS